MARLTRLSSLCRPEAAELAVAGVEEALDRGSLAAVGAADLDEAAHRLEAPDVHDVPVPVEGAPCEGASPPSSKNPDPSSDSSELVAG